MQGNLFNGSNQQNPVIPQVYVPLNASDCMCSSLQELASLSGPSLIETSCVTNDECDGVRCQLNIVNNIFYVETVVFPCSNATDVLVEDQAFTVLFMTTIFNRSEVRNVVIGGRPLIINATVVPMDYSMLIAVSSIVNADDSKHSSGTSDKGPSKMWMTFVQRTTENVALVYL